MEEGDGDSKEQGKSKKLLANLTLTLVIKEYYFRHLMYRSRKRLKELQMEISRIPPEAK